QVRYLAPAEQSLLAWHRLLMTLDYDLIYLEGYFSRLSLKTLWLRRLGLLHHKPVVLAPQGEFAQSALALKWYKKRPYLFLANLLDLGRNVVWHAASEHELQAIRQALRRPARVIAASLPAIQADPTDELSTPDQTSTMA